MAISEVTTSAIDALEEKSAQLRALLCSVYGAGFQNFSNLSDDIKDDILWLAHDLSRDVAELVEPAIQAARAQGPGPSNG